MGSTMRRVCAVLLAVTALVACGDNGDEGGDGGSSGALRVPDDYGTIQEAVDAASPGDLILISPGTYEEEVDVTTDDLVLRGVDRNEVILDGGFELENGIRVLEADGVAVENLTVQNYSGNGFFWTGVDGYRASYVSSIRNGVYGIYAFGSVNGVIEHSYASGSADGGIYVGQCSNCRALVDDVLVEWNGLGYSGTNSGGDLFVVNSEFRFNRVGMAPNTLSTEGCSPQRDATIVGNYVHDNGNPETAAVGFAMLGEYTGILVVGGNANTVERNRVENHEIAGIAVVPQPEEDAVVPIPDETPPDCVADVVPASDDVIAELDNPLVWPVADNHVEGNVVSGSGEWDLVLLTLDGEAHGNCFADNEAEVSAPEDIEQVLPCEGTAQTYEPETARFFEILSEERPPSVDYEDVDLPDPGELENMPEAETASAVPAGEPRTVDVDAISVPAAT
jgi:Right handed beta helix region